jgi:hypothetical protein
MIPRSSKHYDLPILTLALLAVISVFLHSNARDGSAVAQTSPAFSDYHSQLPGHAHHITLQDLPQPFATPSADTPSEVLERPADGVANG